MTERQPCAVCYKDGTTSYSRCGHILHEDCLRPQHSKCPKCGYDLSPAEMEKIYFKIRLSGLSDNEKRNLSNCLFRIELYDHDQRHLDDKSLNQLKSFGWDINSKICGAAYQFHQACKYDDIDRVNLFIEHGFDYSKYGEDGLEEACSNLCYGTFEKLLSLGFKLQPGSLIKLIRSKNLEAVKLAIDSGLDVNYSGPDGPRPIRVAAQVGSIEIIELLIENGAYCQGFNENECTLVHLAAENNSNLRLIKYLEESGFDLNARSEKHQTPLMFSMANERTCVTRYLIDKVGNIEAVDKRGQTALHHSAFYAGNFENMKILLLNGANPNAKDCNGKTPLHVVEFDFYEKVEMLLDHGADMHVRDNVGKVPYDYIYYGLCEEMKQRFIDGGSQIAKKNKKNKKNK